MFPENSVEFRKFILKKVNFCTKFILIKMYRTKIKALIDWKNQPETAIRTSLSHYHKESWMTNVPLYAMGDYL